MKSISKKTFRDFDSNENLSEPTSSLEMWYSDVRDVCIEDMYVGDPARAIRQRIFIEDLMPTCLTILRHDPLTGDINDGELLLACFKLDVDYWASHESDLAILCKAASRVLLLHSEVIQDGIPYTDKLLLKVQEFLEKHCGSNF